MTIIDQFSWEDGSNALSEEETNNPNPTTPEDAMGERKAQKFPNGKGEEEKSTKELMKECGEAAFDIKTGYQTAIKIMWVIQKGYNAFNVH
eukprot:14162058-Ditylum_brightwellii.AAC.1